MGVFLRTGLAWLLAALLALALAPVPARAADGGVLFLSSFSPTGRWTEQMLSAISDDLAAERRAVNLHVEFLDRGLLPDTPDDTQWADFLAARYRDAHIQAVIADGAPAIALLARHGRRVFGAAPVIGIFPNFDDLGPIGQGVAVRVTTGPHVGQTVDMALAQWPAARRLVIVSDDGAPSHHLAAIIRAAVAAHTERTIAVEHLHDFRLEELEDRLAALPRDSIVLYTHVFADNSGRQFRPEDVAVKLGWRTTAPMYALFEGDIGSGAVGGFVNDPRTAGRLAIDAALDLIYEDRRPPTRDGNHYSSRPVADWRQLRRWGIDETTLPPGTEVRFRPPSLLEEYFAETMTALGAIIGLGAALALISALYAQRVRLTRALAEANGRLEERVAARTRDIERALEGEQAARQRLRTFLDMAAHEFKTPLAVIDSSAQMLERLVDAGREEIGGRLTLIRGAARRVADLIETCLADERFDDALPVKLAPFAPAELLDRVAGRQRGHGALVRLDDVSGLPATWVADPDLLGIALDALLDNARRYGPGDAPIELAARRDGPTLVFTVADRGPGVPEDEQDRIFEKYYRGVHSRGTPGTGIGLNLVRIIATLHGGAVACRSREGGGAVFVLVIPAGGATVDGGPAAPVEETRPPVPA